MPQYVSSPGQQLHIRCHPWKLWGKAADLAGYEWVTLKTFKKATATRIARTVGPEAIAYQAGHSKISMPQEHYIEETREDLDTRLATEAYRPTGLDKLN